MQRILREQARKYAFNWQDELLLRVKPGESFEIETYDASTGYFKTPEDKAIPGAWFQALHITIAFAARHGGCRISLPQRMGQMCKKSTTTGRCNERNSPVAGRV
jgi:hypothetical protein